MMFTRKTLARVHRREPRWCARWSGPWNERRQGGYHHERGVRPGARRGPVPADIQALQSRRGTSSRRFSLITPATVPLTSASPNPPTFSCQRRRAARCRRFCSMGGKPTKTAVYHCAAGGSCTALHDRPQGPRRSGRRRDGRAILCCVLGVRAARLGGAHSFSSSP
jgi:hypothetical protein